MTASRARRASGRTTSSTWLVRGGVALLTGSLVGFALGAAAVHFTQPPVATTADSVTADTSRKPRRGTGPSADGASGTSSAPDAPIDAAPRVADGPQVPQLVGLEEGDARLAITRAGFTIGSVLFKSSAAPAGTVLSSFPVPGESVKLPATVNIILSDGRPHADSLGPPATPPPGDPIP
jgi:hypothetical protein